MLLIGISDWKFFEDKLEDEADHWLPSKNLYEKLGIRNWKNIPHPLISMAETFQHCFSNTSNIFTHVIKENKMKTEFITSKFKKVDRKMYENNDKFKRLLEINKKNLLHDISKQRANNDNQVK